MRLSVLVEGYNVKLDWECPYLNRITHKLKHKKCFKLLDFNRFDFIGIENLVIKLVNY
jgi:hypothetical protein